MKQRLDVALVGKKLIASRSQAESYIKLGMVTVNGEVVTKSGSLVGSNDRLNLKGEQYVSRAALKLDSIAHQFKLDFRGKAVLDIGSSTGGFTDYALQHGAKKVIAVDVGTDQLHPSLRADKRVELHEKTDIRDFKTGGPVDIVLADVSFISLRHILPSVTKFVLPSSALVIMCKPQFEAGKHQINKGVVKNSTIRRRILRDFEVWLTTNGFIIKDKADSTVAGAKGNIERFYKLAIT